MAGTKQQSKDTAERIFGFGDYIPRSTDAPLHAIFHGLQLPAPGNDDTYHSTYGFLIFLSDFGTVLRFNRKSCVLDINNPHFLKPLYSRPAGEFIFSIDPGLQCPVTEEQSIEIYQSLKNKYGLTVRDEKPHNLAFMPQTNFPVVIDLDPDLTKINIPRNALNLLKEDVQESKKMITGRKREYPPHLRVQEEKYAPLRQAINTAWPEEKESPDPVGIKEFFNLCREFKKAGKLLSPWEDPNNNYGTTTNKANSYTRKLRKLGIGGAL